MNKDRDTDIKRLKDNGFSNRQIANTVGLSLSTIQRIISRLNISIPSSRNKPKIKKVSETIPLPGGYGIPLMERVQSLLGPRMTQYYGGFKLDGKPCHIDKLIQESGLS